MLRTVVRVATICEKIQEGRLGCFEHVMIRDESRITRLSMELVIKTQDQEEGQS